MNSSDIIKLKPIIRDYLSGDITQTQVIRKLKKQESDTWHFVMDDDRILFRNQNSKIVINTKVDSPFSTAKQVPVNYREINNESLNIIAETKLLIQDRLGNKKIITFSGTARRRFDEKKAKEVIKKFLNQISPDKYIVLTGGYHKGIPLIAAQVAKDNGFKTLAISPQVIKTLRGRKKLQDLYDLEIIEGEDWGEESFLLSGVSDILVIICGGFWTKLEYTYARKFKKKIFLIKNLGGFSEEEEEQGKDIFHISPLQIGGIRGKID
ncbi:hypothetical protein JW766_01220 [Candidatus Dojkabacteria bacterium]|nr:hypothetical protein [Candidatus Dojkabacteria bacterium]